MTMQPPFEQIARAHGPMIRRITSSYEADADLVEELVQETLFAVWRALPSFRGGCSLRTFVARIATNRAVTHVKSAIKQHALVELSEDLPTPENSPEAQTIALDQQTKLLAAVRSLPLAYRQVTMLTLEDLTVGEIAGVLGISVNAVSIRISRAKDLLRGLMGDKI